MRKLLNIIFLATALFALAACQTDSYDSGDNTYSYLRADFGMLQVNGSRQGTAFTTDDGAKLTFPAPVTLSWVTTADTVYRALAYYDTQTERPFTISPVFVVNAYDTREPRSARADSIAALRDPLTVESAWRAGGFLNIGFAVKTGRTDSLAQAQHIGLCVDSVKQDATGQRHFFIHVLHSQNNQPEYYSVHTYMSLPLPDSLRNAAFHLSATTYSGLWRQTY